MILHFYNEKATSTFCISKNNNSIKVGIYGRNEHPNLNQTNFINFFRNLFIAIGGILGFAKIEW